MRLRPRSRAFAGAVGPSSSSMPARSCFRRLVGRLAVDLGDVRLLDAVLRVRERVRERAVVRQQERAGRVDVEAADRDDARTRRDDVDDGAAAVRVARGRDVTDGLVQQDDRELLLRDRAPVDLDAVGRLRRTVFSWPGSPFTRTRPALIRSSALRREAMPARAR